MKSWIEQVKRSLQNLGKSIGRVMSLERWRKVRRFDRDSLERLESEGGGVTAAPIAADKKALDHPVRKSA